MHASARHLVASIALSSAMTSACVDSQALAQEAKACEPDTMCVQAGGSPCACSTLVNERRADEVDDASEWNEWWECLGQEPVCGRFLPEGPCPTDGRCPG
jgi:hypothetical protein